MNSQNLGLALTSERLLISDKSIGISPLIYQYTEQMMGYEGENTFSSGDVIRGSHSKATAIVASIGAGFLRIKSSSGKWMNGESLIVGAENKEVFIELPINSEDKYDHKGELAKSAFVSIPPSFESRDEKDAVIISIDGSNLDRNYSLGHCMLEGKRWVLYGDEIQKAQFISYIAGNKCSVNITCFF
jgi:hypothetical protein